MGFVYGVSDITKMLLIIVYNYPWWSIRMINNVYRGAMSIRRFATLAEVLRKKRDVPVIVFIRYVLRQASFIFHNVQIESFRQVY